ncbi:uncharacterized protein LOC144636179 isoform X2 [Oculina patagonica]
MELKATWKSMCFLLIFLGLTCRDVTGQAQATWLKVNTSPVCFGAKGNKYGAFNMPFQGDLAAIRLVNLHGYVSCNAQSKNYWSYWGCGSYNADQTNVVITDDTNTVVLPPAQLILNSSKWAIIPGYNAVSPELVMSFFSPKTVKSGQQFRLWYGEDLMKHGEGDNGGRACIDVYALYV